MDFIGSKSMYCVACKQIHDVHIVKDTKVIEYKNCLVEYVGEFFYCDLVNEDNEFFNERQQKKNLQEIIKQYRIMNKFVMPEEIIAFRKKYNLTASELSLLLSFDKDEIELIETIKPQTIKQNEIISRAIDQPIFMISCLKKSSKVVSKSKSLVLESALLEEAKKKNDFFF